MPEVIINGPEGRLEGRYHHSKEPGAPVALMLHPHPQHGGNMNNKVIYALFHTFVRNGYSALRFNFRGVGRSQGDYDRGEGELSDAAAALDWLQTYNPNAANCWVAGYSFGAWIGMQLLMRRPEIGRFISIAPPANLYDFSFLAPCPASGLIIHGGSDEAVTYESVRKLSDKLNSQRNITVDLKVIEAANHGFHDGFDEIVPLVETYMAKVAAEADSGAAPEKTREKKSVPA